MKLITDRSFHKLTKRYPFQLYEKNKKVIKGRQKIYIKRKKGTNLRNVIMGSLLHFLLAKVQKQTSFFYLFPFSKKEKHRFVLFLSLSLLLGL